MIRLLAGLFFSPVVTGRLKLVYLPLAVLLCSCLSEQVADCISVADCPAGAFCRIGTCVAVSENETPKDDSSAPNASDLENTNPNIVVTGDGGGESTENEAAPQASDTQPTLPARCFGAMPPSSSSLVINEVLANVPSGQDGDANRDGERDAFDDEFVEIVNLSDTPVLTKGLELWTNDSRRYRFPADCLNPYSAWVVFGGGGMDAGLPRQTEATFAVAERKLGLSNSGGRIVLRDTTGQAYDQLEYGESPAESWTREPDLIGTAFVPHRSQFPQADFSPGTCASGQVFTSQCSPAAEVMDHAPDAGMLSDANPDP